jgi:hypothetical protein
MKFLISQEEPCTLPNTLQIGKEGEQESDTLAWRDSISHSSIPFLIRGVIIFSRSSNYVASSRRKFWKSLSPLSLRSFNTFSWVYSFFFNHSFIHLLFFLSFFFKNTVSALAKTTSFRVTQHFGYRRIRLQLNYCAKLLHRLGTPNNIIVQ